ncbi:unnamed protein product, partial [Effrenium voratum]
LLKRFCKSELARAGSLLESHGRGVDSQSESVVLVQCHDEANMRAVISTVLDVITALLEGLQTQASPPQKLRLVHVLTADGVQRKVSEDLRTLLPLLVGDPEIE